MNVGNSITGKVIYSTDEGITAKNKKYVLVEFEGFYPVILVSKR